MRRFVAVLAAAAVLFVAHGAVALDWKTVSQSKSKIVVFGEPFGLVYLKSQQASSGDYNKAYDHQHWRGKLRRLELRTIRMTSSTGYWNGIYAWETQPSNWDALKDKTIQWGTEHSASNPMGKLDYRYFAMDTDRCFFIKQLFGTSAGGRPNIVLTGYYCQKGDIGSELPARMLALIGYRGEGVPEKPQG